MQKVGPVTKPSKQRKMVYEAPAHIRHKLLAAHLSQELRATHLVKSLSVRSGDTIRVMRGDHKGFEGKISRIDIKKYRIYAEGLTREKVDGTTVFLAVHPSKIMVTRLNLDDKWRKKILERRQEAHKKPKEPLEKQKVEPVQKLPETAELKEPSKEMAAPIAKPPKKRTAKREKKTGKASMEKVEVQPAEAEKGKKTRTRRKRASKAAKKTEKGEE